MQFSQEKSLLGGKLLRKKAKAQQLIMSMPGCSGEFERTSCPCVTSLQEIGTEGEGEARRERVRERGRE